MNPLTADERRRVFLVRQESSRAMLARMSPQVTPAEPWTQRWRLGQIAKAAMIAALLAGGWLAYRVVEFDVPRSIVEVLMPRV